MNQSGAFWDTTNPLKPRGIIDNEATLDIPFDLTAWCSDIGDSIASWTIYPDNPITNVSSSLNGDVIVAFLKMNGAAPGATLKVECRFVTVAGRTDNRTVYLEVTER